MKKKRTDIQALRALAVISVVIYHLWPNRLVGGFMGVDMFFVISGYLMTTTLMRGATNVVTSKTHHTRAALTFLTDFYVRRIKRLVPAALLVLIAILGLTTATGQFDIIQKTAKDVTAASAFVENWLLAKESVNYLAPSEAPTAVQHFWSLSLEEQFYLVWPLLLLGLIFITINLSIVYKKRTKIAGAILPVSLLTVAFFLYGLYATHHDAASAYFITPARVWELLLGGVIAYLPKLKNYDLKLLLPWVGTALCLYAVYKINSVGFPGWHALIPTIGTAMVLYGGTDDAESRFSFDRILRWRPIQWLGDISYSLYLWHWPFIVLVPVLIGIDLSDPVYGNLLKFSILVFSLIVAWLSYHFVEQPPQRINFKKYQVYLLFLIAAGLVATTGLVISHSAQAASTNGVIALNKAAIDQNNTCFGARSIQNSTTCGNQFGTINKTWAQFAPTQANLSLIQDGGRWCDYYRIGDQNDPTKYCTFGDTSAKQQIVLWGDSHADQWVNAFNDIGIRNHIKFVLFSSGTCGADDITGTDCQARINFIKQTRIMQNSSAVIVSFLTKDDYSRSKTTIETVRSMTDVPVYLMQDDPVADNNSGPTCYLTHKSCYDDETSAMGLTNKILEELVNNNVIAQQNIIKTEDMFCKGDKCYSFIGGVSVYHDSGEGNSHISSVYALSLSSMLEQKLKMMDLIE